MEKIIKFSTNKKERYFKFKNEGNVSYPLSYNLSTLVFDTWFSNNLIWLSKEDNLTLNNSKIDVSKYNKETILNSDSLMLSKYLSSVNIGKYKFVNTSNVNNIFFEDTNLSLDKSNSTLNLNNINLSLILNNPIKDISILNSVAVSKLISGDLNLNRDLVTLKLGAKEIFKDDYIKSLDKYNLGIYYLSDISLNTGNKGILIENQNKCMDINSKAIEVNSDIISLKSHGNSLNLYSLDLSLAMFDKSFYISYEDITLDNKSNNLNFNNNLSLSTGTKSVNSNDSFKFTDKYIKGLYTNDHHVDLYKYNGGINLSDIFFMKSINKEIYNIQSIFLQDSNKSLNTLNAMSLSSSNKGIYSSGNFTISKSFGSIFTNGYKTAQKYSKGLDTKSTFKFGYIPKPEIYTLDNILLYKERYIANEEENINFEVKNREVMIDKQLSVEEIHYDGFKKPEINRKGIIDELILPPSDFDYATLGNIVDENGELNYSYVKSFDANKGYFTVTIPLEHPLREYANIAKDYIDLDVNTLEIFIYLIKDIWKENLFKYINMSASDAIKEISKRFFDIIDNHYHKDKEVYQELNRCYRLFRWYSEMAILNNCDYILTYDTKKVEVDFYNKNFKEFSNFTSLENLHISDNYILEPIIAEDIAVIKFENYNKNKSKNLIVNFKLYCSNCLVEIEETDNLNNSAKKSYKDGIFDINLNVKNIITVKIISGQGSCGIACLNTPNYVLNTFTASYKGNYGESNRVLDEMLDLLLVFGTVNDDLKKSLGDSYVTTVVINKLLEYYELHHHNKDKGRRLITKK